MGPTATHLSDLVKRGSSKSKVRTLEEGQVEPLFLITKACSTCAWFHLLGIDNAFILIRLICLIGRLNNKTSTVLNDSHSLFKYLECYLSTKTTSTTTTTVLRHLNKILQSYKWAVCLTEADT